MAFDKTLLENTIQWHPPPAEDSISRKRCAHFWYKKYGGTLALASTETSSLFYGARFLTHPFNTERRVHAAMCESLIIASTQNDPGAFGPCLCRTYPLSNPHFTKSKI